MIKFQRISTKDKVEYSFMEDLIQKSFPKNEYRNIEELRNYTDAKENFHNNVILNDEELIGLITFWDFDTFYYVEHFAIDPEKRNNRYGAKTLQLLCESLQKPVVLEVEMPEDDIAKRRISFYEREGFAVWKSPYKQPPYHTGDGLLPLLIMSYGKIVEEDSFEKVKDRIYHEVYNYTEKK